MQDREAFWREQLRGFSVPTPLVVTGLGGPSHDPAADYGEQQRSIDRETEAAIRRFASDRDLPLDALLTAAWPLLLSRYSGEEDVLFGIASFDSTPSLIPLRVQVALDQPVQHALSRVAEGLREVRRHGDISPDRLRELSEVPDTLPLFASAVMVGDDASGGSEFFAPDRKSPTLLVTWNTNGALGLRILYDPSQVDADYTSRMCGHLETLLTGIVSGCDELAARLPLLTSVERRQLLVDWNDTETDFPADSCLHQLFEAHAGSAPDDIAVIFSNDELTYGDLERRANQLAWHLDSMGIGPETLVGICVERSMELVIGIIGILKAGGAYVPVDPSYPKERLAFMLDDTKVPVLLTQRQLLEQLPDLDARVVCLDTDWQLIGERRVDRPHPELNPDNLAYVIFTSGSTGTPKGIALRHRGVVNNLTDINRSFGVGKTDRVLALSSLSFDMCVYEVLGTLAAGGTIIMPDPDGLKDPAHWAELIVRHRATVWNSAPALLEMLVSYIERRPPLHPRLLRMAILGGDWVPVNLPDRLKALCEDVRVYVLGGATEASIHSTVYQVVETDPDWRSIPYGRPMANQHAYILDAHLQPLPIGVPGELHLGGLGLARGYFNRPEMTKEKFIQHPFSDNGEDRIYKTGDLARWLPDGNIELLGRIDFQVKIRGHRIELGEVAATLKQNESVKEAVVMVREDEPGNRYLVAYVVENPGQNDATNGDATSVGDWRAVYEEIYQEASPSTDPRLNFVGWNSSYTGELLSEGEVREWIDRTVERILALNPRRVLEIGCGTGMVLFRVAPHSERYDATDISRSALETLRPQVMTADRALAHVSLKQGEAIVLEELETGSYDTIVINSVTQHFPSADYLERALEAAVRVVRDGGSIFIGDVRCLPLLRVFHTDIELQRAADPLPLAQLRLQVERRVKQEKELWIDPALFAVLAQRHPKIGRVEIQLKRGRFGNELNRFHYDVTLHCNESQDGQARIAAGRWRDEHWTLTQLRDHLLETKPARFGLTDVPNGRLLTSVMQYEFAMESGSDSTVQELREALQAESQSDSAGVDPEELWALGEELSYRVDICWSASGKIGCFDFIFRREGEPASEYKPLAPPGGEKTASGRCQDYTNRPWRMEATQQRAPQLRAFLGQYLPQYMVPTAFVFLERLPLTPNGKVDRRALPAPDHARPLSDAAFVAPSGPVEKVVTGIWADVLRLESVGVQDNFFDLGGHSLLGTEIVSRAAELFQISVPLRSLLDNPTVARFSSYLVAAGRETVVDVNQIAATWLEVQDLSDDEVASMLEQQ